MPQKDWLPRHRNTAFYSVMVCPAGDSWLVSDTFPYENTRITNLSAPIPSHSIAKTMRYPRVYVRYENAGPSVTITSRFTDVFVIVRDGFPYVMVHWARVMV